MMLGTKGSYNMWVIIIWGGCINWVGFGADLIYYGWVTREFIYYID